MPSIGEVTEAVRRDKIRTVRFQYVDTSLVTRTMVSHVDSLAENVRTGIGIGRGGLSLNATSDLVQAGLYGPESSEFRIVPDLDTFAPLPYAKGNARFISELHDVKLRPFEGDCRYFLRRVISKAGRDGYSPRLACEAEFFLVRREGGRYVPATTALGGDGFIVDKGYDIANDYVQDLFDCLSRMNVEVERLKKESSPAQLEVILKHGSGLKAADDFVTLRDAAKGTAMKMGMFASFLPKPFQDQGTNGLHIHISLKENGREKKNNPFFDPKDKKGMEFSELGYHFVGGIMHHAKGMCALAAPLPNSYRRLIPSGSWCPVNVTYGYDNRSVAIRIPSRSGDPKGRGARCEFRISDPTANPYLLIGTLILAGLDGIKRHLDPGEPFNEDAFKLTREETEKRGIGLLPSTLGEAIQEMKRDSFIRDSLGEPLYSQYLVARESDWTNYSKIVTPWEVDNFILCF